MPHSSAQKLVAVLGEVEDMTILNIRSTYDILYLSKAASKAANSVSEPFLVRTKDIPERNINECRLRSLEGNNYNVGAVVEVRKIRQLNIDPNEIIGVFGTCPCPLKELYLDNNDCKRTMERKKKEDVTFFFVLVFKKRSTNIYTFFFVLSFSFFCCSFFVLLFFQCAI